ncbi:MAG: hypothetical protein R2844_06855 [Caldilineales bacterium]
MFGFDVEIMAAPGHAHNQVMVGWPEGRMSVSPPTPTSRQRCWTNTAFHFMSISTRRWQRWQRCPTCPYSLFAQGHGDAYDRSGLEEVLDYNIRRIETIRELAYDSLDTPSDDSRVLKSVADAGPAHRAACDLLPDAHNHARLPALAAPGRPRRHRAGRQPPALAPHVGQFSK